MPKIESYKQGTPSWADYGAPDQHAAKVFYSDIFGWNYEDNPIDMGEGTMFYSMGMKNRSHTAAIYTQNSDQAEMDVPPHWLVYITVDDVDAIAAKVPDLGGIVFGEPFDVLEAGRMATVQDPTGAVVQFWQPKAHIGAGVKHEHGALTWAELLTTDQASAIEFYSKLLGLGVDDSMITGDDSPYNVFMVGEDGVAGCMTMPDDLQKMNIPSHWDIYFHVDDVDVTVQLASSKGADIKMQPTDIPEVGRIAYIMDPQGAGLGLITPEAV